MIMPTMFDEVRLFCMLFAARAARAASAEAAPRRGLTNERTAMEVSAAIMMVVNGENSHSNAYPETANSRQAAHTGAAPSMAHRTATSSDMRMVDYDSRFWDEYTPISTGIATARTSPAASMAGWCIRFRADRIGRIWRGPPCGRRHGACGMPC